MVGYHGVTKDWGCGTLPLKFELRCREALLDVIPTSGMSCHYCLGMAHRGTDQIPDLQDKKPRRNGKERPHSVPPITWSHPDSEKP
jgi:hypothetical protein